MSTLTAMPSSAALTGSFSPVEITTGAEPGIGAGGGVGGVPSRPMLRYHGGKWVLAKWIISEMPAHKIYCEPFGGAASVLLRKERSYAEIYNDLDGEIVNLFTVARERGADLLRALELTPFARDEFVAAWARTDEPVESARRTVIRSFMGFSTVGATRRGKADGTSSITGFRSNVTRAGTTPAHDWRGYPACFGLIVERLRGVVIENRPAMQVLETHDGPETLHYIDPPYVSGTRDAGGDYCHEMTDADHRALASVLHGVAGKVMLSGYHCALYDELYADWRRVERSTFADGARKRTEVLWMNFQAPDADLFGPLGGGGRGVSVAPATEAKKNDELCSGGPAKPSNGD